MRTSHRHKVGKVHGDEIGNQKMQMKREAATMDENLWGALPQDLLERVLAWLPFVSLFRARGVCKKWKMLVFSKVFLDLCAEVPCREKYFLLFPIIGEQIVCSALDTSTLQWHKIPPLSFLPPQVKYVEGGAGGLLFFSVNAQIKPVILYVCNPMTRCWRKLPPMTHRRTPLVRHMVVDKVTNTYKIIVAGNAELSNSGQDDHRFLSTEVYDSGTNSWSITGSLPPQVDLNWSSAYSNGELYCVANQLGSMRLGVITYNVQDGTWSDEVEELPEGFSLAQVVEAQGRVLTVAEHYKNDIVKSIHVLEINLGTREWTEISKLPRSLLIEFRKICDEESFNCIVQDDRIFLTSFKGMQVLIFNIIAKSWAWLPSYPTFRGLDCRAVGFSFDPSFHTTP
ncbi:unnamed protein product [Calypogeia fissa]